MRILNITIVFSNIIEKYPKSGIFGPEFKDFNFRTKPRNKTNLMVLISNMKKALQKCWAKHPNKEFLLPNLRIFTFSQNFEI